MKAIIYFNLGFGDTLLYIPLLKELKRLGRSIFGLFESNVPHGPFMQSLGLLDDHITLQPNDRWALERFTAGHYKAFDEFYMHPAVATWQKLLMGRWLSKKVVAAVIGKRRWLFLGCRRHLVDPLPDIHDGLQHLRLVNENPKPSMNLFHISLPKAYKDLAQPFLQSELLQNQPYAILQICTYREWSLKNWPVSHWLQWLSMVTDSYPHLSFVMIGSHELETATQQVMQLKLPNVLSLVGKTTQMQLTALIDASSLYVGVDSGPMHLAAALGKPTFSIWGGSNPKLYGYETFDPTRHAVVQQPLGCGPCQSWIGRNESRVKRPGTCPDFACLHKLTPKRVFDRFSVFLSRLGITSTATHRPSA